MEIFSKLNKLKKKKSNCSSAALTIGFFDGVHLGHQQVLKKLQLLSLDSHIITFQEPPFNTLNPLSPPIKLITTYEQKVRLIEKYSNPNYLYTLKGSKVFFNMSYVEFFYWVRKYIPFTKLILGYDSHIGKNKEGSLASLIRLSKKLSFKVETVPCLSIDNKIVSSTYIRKLIRLGNLSLISKFLGRNYSIIGKVSKGRQFASKYFQFSTANLINIQNLELIPFGVYAVVIKYKDIFYKGIANLGITPTFKNQNNLKLEVHIFQFCKTIYNEEIEVFFHHFIRNEKCFSSIEELKNQIKLDIAFCKDFFKKSNYEEIK